MALTMAVEENTAVAGVERAAEEEVGARRAEVGGRGGHEAGIWSVGFGSNPTRTGHDVAHEPQHGRRAVGLAEPAPEPGAADEAEPGLADEGGADEERGLVPREAEEDLLLELLRQRRRRHVSWIWLGVSSVESKKD